MYEVVKTPPQYAGHFAKGVAAVIIVVGVLQAVWIYFVRVPIFKVGFKGNYPEQN